MAFRIGPSGTPDGMSLVEATHWLAASRFTTCEIEFTQRFSFNKEETDEARAAAEAADISYRAHAPLYAILGMEHDSIGRVNSIVGSLTHAMKVVYALGGRGMTAHPGFLKGRSRAERIDFCRLNGERLRTKLEAAGCHGMKLGVENMAHGDDFGSFDDILKICSDGDFLRPVVDWGHYQAHTDGTLKSPGAYRDALDRIEDTLGRTALEETSFQFSGIEYKDNRERKHLPYRDGDMKLEHLLEALTEKDLTDAYIVFETPDPNDMALYRQIVDDFEKS